VRETARQWRRSIEILKLPRRVALGGGQQPSPKGSTPGSDRQKPQRPLPRHAERTSTTRRKKQLFERRCPKMAKAASSTNWARRSKAHGGRRSGRAPREGFELIDKAGARQGPASDPGQSRRRQGDHGRVQRFRGRSMPHAGCSPGPSRTTKFPLRHAESQWAQQLGMKEAVGYWTRPCRRRRKPTRP